MDAKTGLHVTTCWVVLALLSGCSPVQTQVARNAGSDALTFPIQPQKCSAQTVPCRADHLALLSSPDNVVYTTRAEIRQGEPEAKDRDRDVMPRSTARDAAGAPPDPFLNE